ncbi:hypothetical protein WN48_11228 [Eufriesea mexicana]|uniref:Uncharacterized protein n=1 Tax=Eufriesea mexicana TaxID=516756 RepID=A0A310SI92_9HYME|nr:hypothetical protein WN48_11228 [Eufriesea mexicana]
MIEPRRASPALLDAAEKAIVTGQLVQHRGQVARPRAGQVPLHFAGKFYRQGVVVRYVHPCPNVIDLTRAGRQITTH